ncbi:hypothetical protein CEP54_000295 [Fusarium duplospermum]|uniref:Uncharacterized protein n=1 Tax=Fusarium duplospermum TaxID=1325734 RepID=A0A428R8Q3_9HYPO|nr:hypothetical protein CEP54_000295 [Fusarium duplospermum]
MSPPSKDPQDPNPASPRYATHDEPSTTDEISQLRMPDASDELGSDATHDAPESRPPELPQSSTDAAQTGSQSTSVPADTSNSPSNEDQATNENQSQQLEHGRVIIELEFDMSFLDRFDPLTRYDVAAINRQMRLNEMRILAFWKLGFRTQDLTFDQDTLLYSAHGVTEAELQAKIEQIQARRS